MRILRVLLVIVVCRGAFAAKPAAAQDITAMRQQLNAPAR